MRASVVSALASLALVSAWGGCAGSASPYDELSWTCHEDASSCDCQGVPEGGAAAPDGRPGVASCSTELDCCFVSSQNGASECRCVQLETAAGAGGGAGQGGGAGEELACHRVALDHGSTEVVPRCPPITLDDAAVCAILYESCDPEFLASLGLVACCEGLRCGPDANGLLICQPE